MKNFKIRTKLIITIIMSMIILTLFFTLNMVDTYNVHIKESVKKIKEEEYKRKKEELLNYSDMANKVIDSYYQKTKKDRIQQELRAYIDEQSEYLFTIINGLYKKYHNRLSEKKLKELISSTIKATRYGTSGYFWINDFKYKMIMHPIKEQYSGKYFKSDKKVPFVALGVDILKKTKKEKGYIQYSFFSPSSKKYEEKASIVRVFKPFNWIIGTGAYIDDLTFEMQRKALNAIKNMRYGKNGYFWINDMQNKMLMHPIKPEYDNRYFIDTPKVPFVELGTKELLKLKKNRAFIDYSFYTPATKKYSHKLSIVQKFVPWNWVVGTGVYTDYLDAQVRENKKRAKEELDSRVQKILIISLLFLVLMIVVMIKLMESIILNPINEFQSGLKHFFNYLDDETVVVEKLQHTNNDEIGLMVQNTNIAIESAIKTHHELIDLRKQLEIKVDKTEKEFELVDKNRKDSLEYGALIQASLLPDKTKLDNIFSEHFIFDAQKSMISSQCYLFEKIRTDEYLYIVVDCKHDGINGVFTTMLVNAIVKQAITQLKYEKSQEISTSWILEHLNLNIENSKDGFDGAIVYYNRNKQTIQYSSANIPLYYYQDDVFHIIKPDKQSIGLDKSMKYSEHTLDIKESIEFYLSTQHYIKDFIDIYDFASPFQTGVNQFKENMNKMKDDIIVSGFLIDNRPKIIIEYEGEFTQKSVNKYMEMIEDKIDNMGLMSNISTNFVEQYQNILNYAKSEDSTNKDVYPFGSIKLQKNLDNSYLIESVNIVTLADKQKIEPKLFEIQSLDTNGIKKRYRELRRSGVNTHEKGGGIGLYEIAKRSGKIEYEFTQINEDRFSFRFSSCVRTGKK